MSHLSHMMSLPVEAADALTDLWVWLSACVRCKQKPKLASLEWVFLCVTRWLFLQIPGWEQCCGLLVPSWNVQLLHWVWLWRQKGNGLNSSDAFQWILVEPFCSSFVLLSLTTLTSVIHWSFWSTSIKWNAVICAAGARMGALMPLLCMQRRLMHLGLWLL